MSSKRYGGRFRLRGATKKRAGRNPAWRAISAARSVLTAVPPEDCKPVFDRARQLRAVLPRDGSHRRFAEECGITKAPSHRSPVNRLNSILSGYRRVYPSTLARMARVLDRYRAAGWPC